MWSRNISLKISFSYARIEKTKLFIVLLLFICIIAKAQTDTLETLTNQGMDYRRQGYYNEALETFEQALVLVEIKYGNGHPKYASLCNALGELYKDQMNYSKAESFFLKANPTWLPGS